MPRKYARIDGVATLLHHRGPTTLPEVVPDLSRGELVLFLHGGGGNGGALDALLRGLEEHHSPLAFDQPGHGRSGGLDSLGSVDRMVDFSRALVSKLGLRTPVLFGQSMGTAVALQWALDHPGELRALVLLCGGARLPIPDALLEQVQRVALGRERRAFVRQVYAPETSPEVMRRGFMEDVKTDPRVLYGDLLATRGWDVRDRLGEIRLPTLVVVGEHELAPLRAEADTLCSGIPGAERVDVPAAGHMIHLEQPGAVSEAVLRFFEGLPS